MKIYELTTPPLNRQIKKPFLYSKSRLEMAFLYKIVSNY